MKSRSLIIVAGAFGVVAIAIYLVGERPGKEAAVVSPDSGSQMVATGMSRPELSAPEVSDRQSSTPPTDVPSEPDVAPALPLESADPRYLKVDIAECPTEEPGREEWVRKHSLAYAEAQKPIIEKRIDALTAAVGADEILTAASVLARQSIGMLLEQKGDGRYLESGVEYKFPLDTKDSWSFVNGYYMFTIHKAEFPTYALIRNYSSVNREEIPDITNGVLMLAQRALDI
ncbi:MAG: hypothetical protein ACI835_003402 [Planctomycetota bacterium]